MNKSSEVMEGFLHVVESSEWERIGGLVGRGALNYGGVREGFGDSIALLIGEWDDRGEGRWGATTIIYVNTDVVFERQLN